MACDAVWWIGRLQAMSVAEVVHRSWRLARYPIDVVRARTGMLARVPRRVERQLANWQGPDRFYFDGTIASTPVKPRILEVAQACLAGRRVVLGLGELQLPPDPWHFEPRAAAWWPRLDAGRVIAAAPDHFDARLTWEINRGHEWVLLARAYSGTGDRRFRARLEIELDSWRRQNPVGIGINWTSSMEAAIRIHSLAWVAAFLRDDPDPTLRNSLARTIYRHIGFVASHLSRFSSANNHVIVELSGIIVGARVLALKGRLTALHRQALGQLIREIERQVTPDGVDAEMASHYHMFVLEALLLVAFIERAHGQTSPEIVRATGRMADYLSALVCGDGMLLQQGDNDDGKLVPFLADDHAGQLILAAAALEPSERGRSTDREAARSAIHDDDVGLLVGGRVGKINRDEMRSRRFDPSGQVVLRGRRIHVSLDAGPFGFGALAAHAHCDALAIVAAIDGRRLLVDRGTFRYNGDRTSRDRFRMTAAHNTVQVGAREQADAIGPFLWSRKPTVTIERCELTRHGDLVEAAHDGFSPVRHRRTLVRTGDVLLIIDSISDICPGEQAVARWHFAPEVTICEKHAGAGVSIEVGPRPETDVLAWMLAMGEDGRGDARRTRTWHSDKYGAQTTADTLEFELPSVSDGRIVTMIGPGRLADGGDALRSTLRFAVDTGALGSAVAGALLSSPAISSATEGVRP